MPRHELALLNSLPADFLLRGRGYAVPDGVGSSDDFLGALALSALDERGDGRQNGWLRYQRDLQDGENVLGLCRVHSVFLMLCDELSHCGYYVLPFGTRRVEH